MGMTHNDDEFMLYDFMTLWSTDDLWYVTRDYWIDLGEFWVLELDSSRGKEQTPKQQQTANYDNLQRLNQTWLSFFITICIPEIRSVFIQKTRIAFISECQSVSMHDRCVPFSRCLPLEARQIQDNLTQNGFASAAAILSERVNACETAEIFASKNVMSISKEHMVKLLAATQDVEWPPVFQIKIAEHFLRHHIIDPLEQAVKGGSSNSPVSLAKQLAKLIAISSQENGVQAFVPSNPNFTAIFHGLTQLGSAKGCDNKSKSKSAETSASSGDAEALQMLVEYDNQKAQVHATAADQETSATILHACKARFLWCFCFQVKWCCRLLCQQLNSRKKQQQTKTATSRAAKATATTTWKNCHYDYIIYHYKIALNRYAIQRWKPGKVRESTLTTQKQNKSLVYLQCYYIHTIWYLHMNMSLFRR